MVIRQGKGYWTPKVYNAYYNCWDTADGYDYDCDVDENDIWLRLPNMNTYDTLEITHIFLGDYYTTNFPGLEDFVIESMYDIEMVLRYYKAFQAIDYKEMSKIKIALGLEKPKEMKTVNTDTVVKYVNS